MKKLSLCTPAISLTLRPNPQRASFQLLSCTTAFPNKVLLPKWRHHDHLCSSPTSTDYNPIPVGCAFAQKYGVRDKWWCASEAVRVVRTTEKLVQESFRDSISQIQETTQTFKHQAIDIAESNCSGAAKQNCSLRMIVYFSTFFLSPPTSGYKTLNREMREISELRGHELVMTFALLSI